ncbi:MAG: aspartate aminotransferase family protein [Spirochaetes bacterium]|nr:aspartate aminotransferase family protein [Spirochaetota bacterium]
MKDIIQLEKKYVLQTYTRYPVILEKGSGVYVYDNKGKAYLDFMAGISVNNLGYADKGVLNVIRSASKKLVHTSNLFYTEPQVKLAEKISGLTNKGKVFFANSGAEANETAIKIARAYGNSFKSPKQKIITLQKSFHGRTLATVFATGQEKYQKGFEPKIKGFQYARVNDIKSIKHLVDKQTCAIMIEFVQGEGGVNVLDEDFVKNINELCKKHRIILIADEVQTGFGRTGKMFAFEHYRIIPDIVTMAKSIASGLPMGAVAIKNKFVKYLKKGMHASTFGGGYLISTVALYNLEKIANDDFLIRVKVISDYFYKKLLELKNEFSIIKNVRGIGLMLAVELNGKASPLVSKALEKGLIVNGIQNNILRFLPPLIIEKTHVDQAVGILKEVFKGK